jgi:hypothetical protein
MTWACPMLDHRCTQKEYCDNRDCSEYRGIPPKEELGTCDLVSRPHRRDGCGKAWRPLDPPSVGRTLEELEAYLNTLPVAAKQVLNELQHGGIVTNDSLRRLRVALAANDAPPTVCPAGPSAFPGEDAWLIELCNCGGSRAKMRTVLRAFAANLRQQPAGPVVEGELRALREALENLLYACDAVDNDGDLDERIAGSLLDAARAALTNDPPPGKPQGGQQHS